jgi:uncharacterized protein YbjQ (UPF0145 family)
MTTQNSQALILRDQKGDFYVISGETVQAGRVPEDKKQALQEAIAGGAGEVSGYLFDNTFQNAFTGLSQNNTNIGSNFVLGGLVGLNNQSLSQLGVNVGTASTTQAKL